MRFRLTGATFIRPAIILILLMSLMLACAFEPAALFGPTATATLTATPSATSTMTPSPTVTASPTVTLTPTPLPPTATPTLMPRKRIQAIKNYMIYNQAGRIDELAGYDLVILSPSKITSGDLAVLHANGTLAIAYLRIAEVSMNSPWLQNGLVDPKWILGKNNDWGAWFIDIRQARWTDLMISQAGSYLQMGFDGLFLDTVDAVIGYPQLSNAMVSLIQTLRRTNPKALIIQNRGFYVLQRVLPSIDGLMFENVSTGYDFQTDQYILTNNTDDIQKVKAIIGDSKKPILGLDYAAPDDPGRAYRALKIARRNGFIPLVSVIHLNDIPDYAINLGDPADIRILSIGTQKKAGVTSLVVQIENAGLTNADQIALTLEVNGVVLARSTTQLAIGDMYTWTVRWPKPKAKAKINALAAFEPDGNPDNNSLDWVYLP